MNFFGYEDQQPFPSYVSKEKFNDHMELSLPPISLIRDPRIKLPRAFDDSLPTIMRSFHGAIGMSLLFSKIWRPLCSLFDRHGCFLFFKFSLASGVFARAGVERERYSKTSESGVDIC